LSNDEPLVYTTKGNLPLSSLERFFWWEDTPEYTKFVQGYKLNGEVVSQGADVLARKGFCLGAEQNKI
jgi:hypothetical protein